MNKRTKTQEIYRLKKKNPFPFFPIHLSSFFVLHELTFFVFRLKKFYLFVFWLSFKNLIITHNLIL